MTSTLYQLYKNDVFTLAETMVIKHHAAAVTMNELVRARGFQVDPYDLSTWKYYMNLAGQYHPADLSRLNTLNNGVSPYILIKTASDAGPVDTPFMRALLEPPSGDIAIANEYQYNSTFYQELLNRYPEFSLLIRGIRYPVPLAVSLRAKDFDILFAGGYYRTYIGDGENDVLFVRRTTDGLEDTVLIEPQESTLITSIQQFVKAFTVRWYNPNFDANPWYNVTDTLHFTSLLGIFYGALPGIILNLRQERAFTPEVHSYHIRAHLESHGRLSKYIPDLKLREVLFLYRNIRYLYRNIGKESTFRLLVDRLATPSGVPLASYTLRHDLGSQPEELLPDAFLRREVINFQGIGSGKGNLTIEDILEREKDLAKDNALNLEEKATAIHEAVVTARGNRFPTKYIESIMVDNGDRVPYPLSKVLLNHWIFTATQGYYSGSIYATHPITGDRIHLSPLNALILMFYCFNKGLAGKELEYLPTINALLIPRRNSVKPFTTYPNEPTFDDIYEKVERDRVSEETLTELKGSSTPLFHFVSSDTFFRGALAIQKEMMRRYFLIAKEENYIARGQLQNAMYEHYWLSTPCAFSDVPTLYTDWLNDHGVSLADFDREDYVNLGNQLLRQGTGIRETQNKALQRMQTAVIEIMRQLSSYSVQYYYQINDRPAITTNTSTLRLSNYRVKGKRKLIIRLPTAALNGVTAKPKPIQMSLEGGTRLKVTVTPAT